ncbi:hypothetical protein GGR50DRAFT_687666 [Xylaria sp. CBS 124048]|nr:hypothetical protein GGR50DRAFT_687666 [Xylaria sp. CBS 124048]
MAPLNLYLAYKRDTSRLIYWIVKASNAIITSSATIPDDAPNVPNTDGQITVSSLVALSKLIAKHINPVPSAILALFQSAIQARRATYAAFQQLVANKSDPEVERSNASHKHFIDALVEAFEALGGTKWAEKPRSQGPSSDDEAELEQALFANKFAALSIEGDTVLPDEAAGDNGSDVEPQPSQSSQKRQQKKSSGKGKKAKHGKNAKKKKQPPPTAKTQSIDEVPVESYRIIQDEEGIMTDYLMAVYALIQEWAGLRAHVQGLWYDVAYHGLNSAVAGALSNVAIKMIECSAAAMFIDFPGHDSYETVVNTITRGDPDKAQGMFRLALHKISPDMASSSKVQETAVDVKEQFLIYAYRDLVDFVTDFQKTRSGKPTKRMLSQIGNWDPNLDLGRASETERLNWRRSYTINWLYDLVNIFSSIVVQRNTMKGEHHVLESVDWSPSGPWDKHRRLFGLNEFAGVITHLAMQKPGTDILRKILPHHVFQLQCIVDSFTISRGWSLSGLRGHVLKAPPMSFRPRRDVDLFVDRNHQRPASGFLQSVDLLMQLFQKDGILHKDLERHKVSYEMLEALQYDFCNWLGESKYQHGLTDIAPSRFSNSNSNGLWEYSPFLCGVGLEEALREAYEYGFKILDALPEPILLVHLHNMLVRQGYIDEPVGLYASFTELFPTAFFADGRIPTSKFGEALQARVAGLKLPRRGERRSFDDAKDRNPSHFFKTKSYLMACHESGWNPDRIPDCDVPMPSLLGIYRISQTRRIVDSITGRKRLADTDLVRRARAQGITEKELLAWDSFSSGMGKGKHPLTDQLPQAVRDALVPEGYKVGNLPDTGSRAASRSLSGPDLLELLKLDISNDICGDIPLSSLNYVWTMCRFMMLFHQFEKELSKVRNPLYVMAYETEPLWQKQKRVGLAFYALHLQDEQCLRIMAREFQNPRAGFMNHIYWDDLESTQIYGEKLRAHRENDGSPDQCSVM